ncbi:hypothetical protein LTR53_010207 [Teratosphaeriaceae sp. CCFEE 6253]|nr:hypothetical protein LTR53_010207 [Teratosphaeriaceae sp. CCFEE 6253]
MSDPIHSTGRGGAGNIGPDSSAAYTDGGITREGPLGESARGGDYSAGRGGAGNIGTPREGTPRSGTPVQRSEDMVPETAMRSAEGHENYHTGRGGSGNEHRDKYGGHSGPQKEHKESGGLMEKVKEKLGGHKKE